MKKIQYLLLLLILLFSSQNCLAQDAYYVYKKNGDIQIIFADQIKSISYSKTSTDGIECEDVVTQVIETTDSVYLTDIAEVDSVGFHPLPTVLHNGVTVLDDELMDYISSADDDALCFTLTSSIPHNLIPHVGDKLVTTTCNRIFPNAFAGRVISVSTKNDGIEIECEDIDLTEIFETLYLSSMYYDDGNRSQHRAPGDFEQQYEPAVYKDSFTFDILDTFNSGIGWDRGEVAQLGLSATNFKMHGEHYTTVRQIIALHGSTATQTITFVSDISANADVTIAGHIQGDAIIGPTVPVTGCPFGHVYIHAGLYLSAGVELASEFSLGKSVTVVASFCQNLRDKSITANGRPQLIDHDKNPLKIKSVLLNGKFGIGLAVDFGVSPLYTRRQYNKASLKLASYAEFEGDYIIHDSDAEKSSTETTVYERLRKTRINANLCSDVDLIIGPFTIPVLHPRIPRPEFELVPEIKLDYFYRDGDTEFISGLTTKGNMLLPVSVYGVIAKDKEEKRSNEVALSFGQVDQEIVLDFNDMIKGKEFSFHPVCKFMNLDLAALLPVEIPLMKDIENISNEGAYHTDVDKFSIFQYTMKHSLSNFGYTDTKNKIELTDSNDMMKFSIGYNSFVQDIYHYIKLDEDEVNLDFSNFVATYDGNLRVVSYFVLPGSPNNAMSFVASNPYKHTFRFDKKPKVTFRNAHATGTTVIEEKTMSDGSIKQRYETTYTFTQTWEGTFWMRGWERETDNGFYYNSTGTNISEYVPNDRYLDETSQSEGKNRWWGPTSHHTIHYNLYLRDGSIIQSNSLIFQDDNVSVGAGPYSSASKTKGTYYVIPCEIEEPTIHRNKLEIDGLTL